MSVGGGQDNSSVVVAQGTPSSPVSFLLLSQESTLGGSRRADVKRSRARTSESKIGAQASKAAASSFTAALNSRLVSVSLNACILLFQMIDQCKHITFDCRASLDSFQSFFWNSLPIFIHGIDFFQESRTVLYNFPYSGLADCVIIVLFGLVYPCTSCQLNIGLKA